MKIVYEDDGGIDYPVESDSGYSRPYLTENDHCIAIYCEGCGGKMGFVPGGLGHDRKVHRHFNFCLNCEEY